MHGLDNIFLVDNNTKERTKRHGDGSAFGRRRKQGKEKFIKDMRYYFVDADDSGVRVLRVPVADAVKDRGISKEGAGMREEQMTATDKTKSDNVSADIAEKRLSAEIYGTAVKRLPAKILAAAVLTSLLLSGCGSQEDAGTGESIEAKADAEEGFLVQNPEWEPIETENGGAGAGQSKEAGGENAQSGAGGEAMPEGMADSGAEGKAQSGAEGEAGEMDEQTKSLFGDVATMNNDVNGRELPIYCVDTEEKKVALSFDAGWGNEDTAELLEILKNHDLKVTFFMTGEWVSNYPDDVKAILQAGHDLGNHSENHKNMSQISDEDKKQELMKVHDKVKELTGYEMFLFRPPYGDYDNAVIDVAKDCKYYTIQWDVDSLDWQNKGVDSVITTVTEHKNLGNGSIILCHNGAEYTAQALDTLITRLQDMGYEIVPVSELIYKEDFHMNFAGRQIKNED